MCRREADRLLNPNRPVPCVAGGPQPPRGMANPHVLEVKPKVSEIKPAGKVGGAVKKDAAQAVKKAGEGATKDSSLLSSIIDVDEFERSLVSLNPNERVAKILEKAKEVAKANGWEKTDLSAKNGGRTIYFDRAKKQYYAVDRQHGRFELCNKRGKHLGELKMDLSPVENKIDHSGGHDIIL